MIDSDTKRTSAYEGRRVLPNFFTPSSSTVLKAKLNERGVLDQIKARVRSEIFAMLDEKKVRFENKYALTNTRASDRHFVLIFTIRSTDRKHVDRKNR